MMVIVVTLLSRFKLRVRVLHPMASNVGCGCVVGLPGDAPAADVTGSGKLSREYPYLNNLTGLSNKIIFSVH